MTDHGWIDRSHEYALGMLGPAEAAEFERHMESCAPCREAVRGDFEALAALSHLVPPAEPPDRLRDRVMASIDEPDVEPIRRPVAPWIATAAAVIAAIVAGSLLMQTRAERDRLLAERDTALSRVEIAEAERAEAEELVAAILSADVETATLASDERAPRGRVFWNREEGVVLITAFDLPSAPSGRTYQLWGLTGDPDAAPISLGTFDTRPDGSAALLQRVPEGAQLVATAVSEEPTGGSTQPTTQPFLIGELGGA